MTAQALTRREPQRRYPILLALVPQSAAEVLDEVVQLFAQAVSARESKAARKMACDEDWRRILSHGPDLAIPPAVQAPQA